MWQAGFGSPFQQNVTIVAVYLYLPVFRFDAEKLMCIWLYMFMSSLNIYFGVK